MTRIGRWMQAQTADRGRFAAALAVVLAGALPAQAQLIEEVDPSLLKTWRLTSGNELRFCQFESNLTNDFDRAVAEEIATRLLLEPKFQTLVSGYGVDGDGLETTLFVSLTNDCDVMLGFQVSDIIYPVEFTVTRPYVGYNYLVLTEAGYDKLADFPPDSLIATQISTPGDLAFAREMAARPPEQRLRRMPFGSVYDMMDATLSGSVTGMLMFSPVYAVLQAQYPDAASRLHAVEAPATIVLGAQVGGLMLAKNAFLRGEVDAAIASMVADGTIATLLEQQGLGSISAIPGGF